MSQAVSTIAVIGTRGFPGVQGGVEMHCMHLYEKMASRGDVHIRVYRRKPYLSDASRCQIPNISFVDLPSTRIKGFEALWHTLISCLHIIFHRPDVVHVHNIGPGLFSPLLRLAGLRVVMTYHSPNYEHAKWGALSKRMLRLCESISLKCCQRVIFVNKFQMQKFSAKVQTKSVYIPNGIPAVQPSNHTSFLEQHGIQPGDYVLAVGRLTPEKGFEYLVEAAAKIQGVKQIVIAGASDHDTEYLKTLQQLNTANRVVFTGFASGDNLVQLYSHARAFVLSSVNEGFPLVLLEAMNYGLPVAVSDIPATHLVKLPKEVYFPVGNVDTLASVVDDVLQSGISLIQYDLTDYDWNAIAQHTRNILL